MGHKLFQGRGIEVFDGYLTFTWAKLNFQLLYNENKILY